MLTQTEKDERRAQRLNARRLREWRDTVPSLFAPETLQPPKPLTAEDVDAKRRRDQQIGQESLQRVRNAQRQADEQADLMREVFALFRGEYLALLRENSISPDLRRYRWGIWEKHLHSIGVVVVGVLENGETLQVTAERPEGMAVFGDCALGNALR